MGVAEKMRERIERREAIRSRLSGQMRKAMRKAGKNVATLSADAGLSADMIYKILGCKTSVSTDRLTYIADALDVTPASLLTPME